MISPPHSVRPGGRYPLFVALRCPTGYERSVGCTTRSRCLKYRLSCLEPHGYAALAVSLGIRFASPCYSTIRRNALEPRFGGFTLVTVSALTPSARFGGYPLVPRFGG